MTNTSTATAHTAGPWDKEWSEDEQAYTITKGLYVVAAMVPNKSNARLIAAAPDLLDALEYLLQQTVDMDLAHGIELTEGEQEAREKAIAAIAQATSF